MDSRLVRSAPWTREPVRLLNTAIEAARIAVTYRTPVIVLSDGYLANGSEPWRLPDVATLPDLSKDFAFATNQTHVNGDGEYRPFKRDPQTLARPWAIPARRALSTASAASRRPTAPGRSPTTRITTT